MLLPRLASPRLFACLRAVINCWLVFMTHFETASALSGSSQLHNILHPTQSFDGTQSFRLQPKQTPNRLLNNAIRTNDLDTAVRAYFRQEGLHPSFSLRKDTSASETLSLTGGSQSSLRMHLGGIPLCEGHVRVSALRDGSLFVVGQTSPIGMTPETIIGSFVDDSSAMDFLERYAGEHLMGSELTRYRRMEECLRIKGEEIVRTTMVGIDVDGLPFHAAISDQGVDVFHAAYFDAVGVTKTYKQNPTDKSETFFTLGDLTGDGTLSSSTFKMVVNTAKSAQECDHTYDYEPSDERFQEASVFTHASRALSWFTANFGYTYEGNAINVRIHETFGQSGDKNNGIYVPEKDTVDGKPAIRIGDGDGIQLQGLSLDADVINHEFNHHIVYRKLKSLSGESLVLHESLADFFTFARTDNACLGETICPDGGQICWSTSCLRTAENSLTYVSADLPSQAHKKSQFISAMLWDLKIKQNMAIGDVAQIVFQAVELFSETMSFATFVSALINADQDVFDGANCEKILTVAKDRGLSALISTLSCSDKLTDHEAGHVVRLGLATSDTDSRYILQSADSLEDSLTPTSNCPSAPNLSSSLLTPQCGTVGGKMTTLASLANGWYLLLLPFMTLIWHRRK